MNGQTAAASNPYGYYSWNPYSIPGMMHDGGVWSSRDTNLSYSSYGPSTGDYMQTYPMFDYASSGAAMGWYPNVDYGTGTSTAYSSVQSKARDYMNPSYYDPVGVNGSAMNGFFTGKSEVNNGVEAVEQDMKKMHLASPDSNSNSNGQRASTKNSNSGAPAKPISWANVASLPPTRTVPNRPKIVPRAPIAAGRQNQESNAAWDGKSHSTKPSKNGFDARDSGANGSKSSGSQEKNTADTDSGKMGEQNSYNPKDFDLNAKGARFFVIKSFSEDDIHRSIKYSIWCSTEYGNKRLDAAYKEREGKGPVYLLFSVNGSGHFCGMAQMTSAIDYHSSAGVWAQDKWKGQFSVKWIYVKDVPNSQLRHIKLENNENKPVTNSRDTQEVLADKGKLVLRIIHQYRHTTSIFDDFSHYEKQQEETDQRQVGLIRFSRVFQV